jgi:L-fuconate dehydratase
MQIRSDAPQIRKQLLKKLLNLVGCHQVWGVDEAIDWMKKLAQFKPWFIEEPTAPGKNNA